MLCKWCGSNSLSADRCSECGRKLGVPQRGEGAPSAYPPRSPRRPVAEPKIEAPELSTPLNAGRFSVAFGGVLLLLCLLVRSVPGAYVAAVIVAAFAGGLLLPVLRVVPWADDDADDALWLFAVTVLFGPAVGLAVYAFSAVLRREANPAVFGCLIATLLARLCIDCIAGGPTLRHLMPWTPGHFDWRLALLNWAGLAAMGGWYAACVFHKLDD